MNRLQSIISKRAQHLMLMLMAHTLILTSHAFQLTIHHHNNIIPSTHHMYTTTILNARKGNRGPGNVKSVSENTAKRTRPQVNDLLDGINSDPEFPHSVDPTDLPAGSINDDPTVPLVNTIVHAADMRKAM